MSFDRITTDDGSLKPLFDCYPLDVYEAVGEMYGMIWYLAHLLYDDGRSTEDFVQLAQENYKQGLTVSPLKKKEK